MKKYIILLGILIVASILIWQLTNIDKGEEVMDDISVEEQEFNDSGRAKAIEDEKDLWMIYENQEMGFSVKYPGDIELNPDKGEGLYVMVKEINPEEPSMLPQFPVDGSEEAIVLGEIEAKTSMTLGRFEVCDVTLEREVRFEKNNYEIIIMLKGDTDVLAEEHPEYFTLNEENCGDMSIWDFDKQSDFFKQLEIGEGGIKTQEWFDKFDDIASTIELFETKDYEALIQGVWISVDDVNSVIEFNVEQKTDYYEGEKLREANYELMGNSLIVEEEEGDDFEYEIIAISENELEMIYLPRGNILKYTKQ